VQKALGVSGSGCDFLLATCLAQFAKAGSAATLTQQGKHNSENLQRGNFIPRSDVHSANSARWPIALRGAWLNRSYVA
jgi:hypothetical protein